MVIDCRTKMVGLIGYPAKYSLSPAIHNGAFEALGLNIVYSVFPVEPKNLEAAVKGMAALGFLGFNVTIPHKRAVMPFLHSIDGEAEQIGAVNTVVISDHQLIGYNTDGVGFIQALEDGGIDAAGKNILLLGAGGAAKAIAVALALRGAASITIAVRTLSKGKSLAEKIAGLGVKATVIPIAPLTDSKKPIWYNENAKEENFIPPPDIVINATPVGMTPEEETDLIKIETLPQNCVVCDLVYGPQKTMLLEKASDAGHVVLDGSGMLLHQGAKAFTLFTGINAPLEAMKKNMAVAL